MDKKWYVRKATGEATQMTASEALEGQFCPVCGRDCVEYSSTVYQEMLRHKECIQCQIWLSDADKVRKQREIAKHEHFTRIADMLVQRKEVRFKERLAEVRANLYGEKA